eukprot:COSAG02_NODE_15703_length_1147_cov_1.581107_1_plen_65_part_00
MRTQNNAARVRLSLRVVRARPRARVWCKQCINSARSAQIVTAKKKKKIKKKKKKKNGTNAWYLL